jgi:hypothetical protein
MTLPVAQEVKVYLMVNQKTLNFNKNTFRDLTAKNYLWLN